jgi:carbon-monoxide dehydrogenase small subunit
VSNTITVRLHVNGVQHELSVTPLTTLATLLREAIGLTGTHLGCEEGVCGSCTVLLDGRTLRSCLTLAAQMQDASITTAEGYAETSQLRAIQRALVDHFAAQCGFCTSGMMAVIAEYLNDATVDDHAAVDAIRERLNSVVCRCTGYEPIVAAVRSLAVVRHDE